MLGPLRLWDIHRLRSDSYLSGNTNLPFQFNFFFQIQHRLIYSIFIQHIVDVEVYGQGITSSNYMDSTLEFSLDLEEEFTNYGL